MPSSRTFDDGYIPGAGLPVAPPVALLRPRTNAQVSDLSPQSAGTNTPWTSSPENRHPELRPVSAKSLARLGRVMPERDKEVLRFIAEHRFLSTSQIKRFVFTTHASDEAAARTARSVVSRLERAQLIRSLGRRVGGVRAGSTAKIWQLAPAAARLLRDDGVTYRTTEPSLRFLAHCLATADVHLAVRDLSSIIGVQSVAVETEPHCWRRFTGLGGEAQWLQPDLAAVVATSDFDDRWFLEVDLGTESLPTLLKKCGRYEAYRATGQEQERHGAFPLVLWLFTRQDRADRLQAAIDRSPRLTPHLYRIATPAILSEVLRRGGA